MASGTPGPLHRCPILGVIGLVACRLGGPTADPNEYVALPDAAGDRASPVPVPEAAPAGSGDGESTATGGDATPDDVLATISSGEDTNEEAGSDANTADSAADATSDSASCSAAVAVCDPIHNTGCNSLQQCDVDTSQTTVATGLCVFFSGAEGGPCLSTIFTESCPPEFTCVGGDCRQLCSCNADCPTGQCCSDTSGPTGFTLCQACL